MPAPCVAQTAFGLNLLDLYLRHIIRRRSETIVRVIVVQSTGTIHVTLVVRVGRVRQAKPPVPGSHSEHPMHLLFVSFAVGVDPRLELLPRFNN